jgi:hypothetical protein
VPVGVVMAASALTLLIAALIGPRLAGVLIAVLAPPEPPVPEAVTLLSHKNLAYGVDDWVYETTQDACQLVTFFEAEGAQCPVRPPSCGGSVDDDFIARCFADVAFSSFVMRWRFELPLRSVGGGALRFTLGREVSWLGALPPENSPTVIERSGE